MGEIIGMVKCPHCGQQTGLKVNINGCFYIICRNRLKDGSYCGYRETHGKSASKSAFSAFENGADMVEILNILKGHDDDRDKERRNGRTDGANDDGIIRPIPI